MAITLLTSDDLWNDTTHVPTIASWDPLEVHVRFDQPILHALEYVEAPVTRFWVDVAHAGEPLATLTSTKLLAELNDEARTFKNGRFRFSLAKLPDALSQHHHARFAEVMAARAPGSYPLTLTLHTDNPLQKDKILAECTVTFELAAGSADHLRTVAAKNREAGADDPAADDTAARAAHFERLAAARASAPSASSATATARVRLRAERGDVRVRLHTGPGASLATTVQRHVTSDWHTLVVGSRIELLDAGDQKVAELLPVVAGMDGTTLTLG